MENLNAIQILLLIIFLAWTFFWKGMALWKAARNNQQYWFVALLVVNTVGILEIVYLTFFQKNLEKNKAKA